MRNIGPILLLIVLLLATRSMYEERLAALIQRIRDWVEETHSASFELRRHFFGRFFDSELISDPNQAKVVAGGVLAILLSLSAIYTQAYFHKYVFLDGLDMPEPFQLAELADFLFLITFTMAAAALLTTLQWPSLFPSLRDYLALAGLPLRMREVFTAKFLALSAFATIAIFAAAVPPSGVFMFVMRGRWAGPMPVPAITIAAVLAGFFVFFTLVSLQGVLLNLLPVKQFHRVSLAVQGLLLAALLCSVPMVISISDLAPQMHQRPSWAMFAPPLWFLGLDQVMMGSREPLALRLAWTGLGSDAAAAAVAVLTYMWSYRRHRVRAIESPGTLEAGRGARLAWAGDLLERLIPDSRALAVFSFIGKNLARSRQHRLILTAFASIALAVISEGFFSLMLHSGSVKLATRTPAFDQAVIAAPLALSLFTLAGLRYLFRLPVELRANWVFRLHEPGSASVLLSGVESFLLWWGVAPVTILTLPAEIALLGVRRGLLASLLCLLASLALMELLLFRIERIPFTSSYFPGKDPPVVTLVKYAIAASLYVGGLSSLMRLVLRGPGATVLLLVILAAAWLRARYGRLGSRELARLEFEELGDPVVQLLGIEAD